MYQGVPKYPDFNGILPISHILSRFPTLPMKNPAFEAHGRPRTCALGATARIYVHGAVRKNGS